MRSARKPVSSAAVSASPPGGAQGVFVAGSVVMRGEIRSFNSDTSYDDELPESLGAEVPLPAAAWLLIGGVAALGVARRRAAA